MHRPRRMRIATQTWFFCGMFGLLLFAGSSPVFAGDLLRRIQMRGELVWGADQEGGGPFVFPDPSAPQRQLGFEVELAAYIAQKIGVTARFAQNPWEKLPDLVERGDIDLVLNGYEWSPARAARYGCSIPYYIYELQLLARRQDATLRSWDDLFKDASGRRRVAVLGGSAAHDYLAARGGQNVDIVSFDGATDAMRAVELGTDSLDANLQDLPIWTFYRQGFPELIEAGPPVGRGCYVALVRKSETELLAAVNKGLLDGLQDGSLRRIFEKYAMWNPIQAARGLEVDSQGTFVGDASLVTPGGTDETPALYVPEGGWQAVVARGALLVKAAGMTVVLAVVAMPLAILLGLATALLRLYGRPLFARLAALYVEILRGTPLVLQLYVLFFLLPEIGISLHAFWAAVCGLAINYSAYEAEIYRAGIQAIPRGQMEAALSLGMSRNLALRRIIVPQATRIVIPPMTNDFIALFKDTAVCSVITVVELSKQYYVQARSSGAVVELGLLTALLYLAMSYPLSRLASHWERRLAHEPTL